MPRHYQDNDRPLKYNPRSSMRLLLMQNITLLTTPESFSHVDVYIEPSIIRYCLTAPVYGHQFLTNNDEMSVAKAVLDNRKQSPTTIVSHKLQKIIQSHIIWYWD